MITGGEIFVWAVEASFFAFAAMAYYDIGLQIARRFGWTKRKGPITRFVEWAVRPLLGDRNDYGEWRGRKWREANPEKACKPS